MSHFFCENLKKNIYIYKILIWINTKFWRINMGVCVYILKDNRCWMNLRRTRVISILTHTTHTNTAVHSTWAVQHTTHTLFLRSRSFIATAARSEHQLIWISHPCADRSQLRHLWLHLALCNSFWAALNQTQPHSHSYTHTHSLNQQQFFIWKAGLN